MTTELVGPLPTIRFADGSRQAYTPPRDTCDNRYAHCTNHHPACDCREALFAEDQQEWRAMREDARMVIEHLIDAPCPPDRRRDCQICAAALGTWLQRYDALYLRKRVPL